MIKATDVTCIHVHTVHNKHLHNANIR